MVLLNVPPSRKAFRQRLGRAGRRSRGACLMIDTRGVLSHSPDALRKYLAQPLEPSWVYLDNRYIQYANALCAAAEWADAGRERVDVAPFASLPETFVRYVENELNPTESVPADLYSLKQRAQNGPHMEFPIRSAMERSFQIRGGFSMNLGTLSLPQVLREAYPGALYYYMARPHRVTQVSYRDGTIHARRDRFWTTRPLAQAMVFPNFDTGLYRLLRSERGFVAEASMQVSERVTGFVEQRGSTQEQHLYGTGSPYSQRPLTRFFETTGVCWCFPERCAVSEETAQRLLEAFCMEFGVQERDLGVGLFHARRSPTGAEGCQGICVFDATNGSLRLTERLGEQFSTVVTRALTNARALEDAQAETELRLLAGHVAGLRAVPVTAPEGTEAGTGNHDGGDNEEWQELIAPGEPAVNNPPQGSREIVKVLGHRYTPRGWYYDLEPHPPMDRWSVPTAQVQPIPGETRRLRVNAITGETEPLE